MRGRRDVTNHSAAQTEQHRLLPPPACPVSHMFPVSQSRYLTGKETQETMRLKGPADLSSPYSLRREGWKRDAPIVQRSSKATSSREASFKVFLFSL